MNDPSLHLRCVRVPTLDGVSVKFPVSTHVLDVRDARVRPRRTSSFHPSLFQHIASLVLVVSLSTSAFGITYGKVGTTLSYFRDIETSIGNLFRAGLLDFVVADDTIARTITATTTPIIIPVMTPEPGSFPPLYRVTSEQTSQGFVPLCSALNAVATTSPFIVATSTVLSLNTTPTTTVGTWNLGLVLSATTTLSHGDICELDLIYRGWHPQTSPEYTGFTDEERVHLIITYEATASVFDIVLNEFLPNPHPSAGGMNFGTENDDKPLGEWIELYNKGDIDQDIAGWFMTDASGGVGNTHAVISAANTLPAGTIIPANGWLVVFMGKPSLNNTGDEIFLHTPDGVQVDFVSYDSPSSDCENDPTLGTGNVDTGQTGTPGNGPTADCVANQVAPNKSCARIPDGTGEWVDPIPTPGSPNIPDPVVEAPPPSGEESVSSPAEPTEPETAPEEEVAELGTPDEVLHEPVIQNSSPSEAPTLPITEEESQAASEQTPAPKPEPEEVVPAEGASSESTEKSPEGEASASKQHEATPENTNAQTEPELHVEQTETPPATEGDPPITESDTPAESSPEPEPAPAPPPTETPASE